jgi:hypothetical protein
MHTPASRMRSACSPTRGLNGGRRGASQRPDLANSIADYAATVGELHRLRDRTDGAQPGDPARAAQVIAGLPDLEQPPLRLLLGSDALNLAEKASRSRAAEAERWADVSRSTDYEEPRRSPTRQYPPPPPPPRLTPRPGQDPWVASWQGSPCHEATV